MRRRSWRRRAPPKGQPCPGDTREAADSRASAPLCRKASARVKVKFPLLAMARCKHRVAAIEKQHYLVMREARLLRRPEIVGPELVAAVETDHRRLAQRGQHVGLPAADEHRI